MHKLITLKASNLLFVGADANQRLVAKSEQDYPIFMQELPGEKVHLRSMKNGFRYFEALNGGGGAVMVAREEPNDDCVFTVRKAGTRHVALATRSARYLSVQADGNISANAGSHGQAETFLMSVLREQATQPAEYDKMKLGGDILWDDHTHAAIVNTTLRLLAKNHAENPYVKALRRLTDLRSFKDKMLEGLKDADYKSEYTGIFWSSHFYNPNSGKNYIGLFATALDKGVQYFNESQGIALSIFGKWRNHQNPTEAEIRECGYKLGLALHYVTDLTQPMHSGNFTNIHGNSYPLVNPCERRHSGLEQAMEDLVAREGFLNDAPDFSYQQFNPDTYPNAVEIIREAAVISFGTFENRVKPILNRNEYSWFGKDVRDIAEASIKTIGLHSVARFLAFWAKKAASLG